MEITLSSNEFKALSSETRTSIIKILNERNHTLSELAEKLELASPTVKQHLEKLESAQLVELIDSGHKWKYYTLTRKGKKIMEGNSSQNSGILIVLGLSTILLIAILFSFISNIGMLSSAGKMSVQDNFANSAIAPSALGIANEKTTASTGQPSGNGAQETIVPNRDFCQIEPAFDQNILAYLASLIVVSIAVGYTICRIKRK